MTTIIDEYVAKHHRSRELYEEAVRTFPGGVTHDTRLLNGKHQSTGGSR